MKKLRTAVLIIGALISANNIYADGNKSKLSWKPAKDMQVSFNNVSPGSELTVKDSNGQILFSEKIRSEGTYNRRFDFSSLPSNDYFIEIDKEAYISIYPFTVVDASVMLHDDLRSIIIKPVLLQENNRVRLVRNLDEKQSLKVEIYYQGRDLIFSETIDEEGAIGRTYNLSKSARGAYLFHITYGDRSKSEYLSINTL